MRGETRDILGFKEHSLSRDIPREREREIEREEGGKKTEGRREKKEGQKS